MLRTMLQSKIHGATVTEADLNYMGSISIDKGLMEKLAGVGVFVWAKWLNRRWCWALLLLAAA